MERTELLQSLEINFKNLPAKDHEFAESLINQGKSRGLSDRQWYWVGVLQGRATGKEERKCEKISDFGGVYAMFRKAKEHLMYPKFVLQTATGREYKLYLSGERSKTPNVVNVVDGCTNTWFGRVLQDGTWEKAHRTDEDSEKEVAALLTELAEHPEEVAAAHGKLTGNCCFCSRKLSDERSTNVGYGKTCADHYGLKWGK